MRKVSKGNAVIGQSGGPTSAINSTLAGAIKGCLENPDIEKIYGMKNGIEGLLNEEFIYINQYFTSSEDKTLDLLATTPAAALGSCRKKIKDEETIKQIFSILEKYGIRYFFYIGGNDSMDTIKKLSEYASANDVYEVNFIGIPKTIDNDLVLTDHTPGYGCAAKFIAVSMQEIMRDVAVYTTKAVTIVEIMGRDAGWLTGAAALTKHISGVGPELIYLPEIDFSEEKFLTSVQDKLKANPTLVVAVSEGIRTKDGKYVAESAMIGSTDNFGHTQLGGTGKYLENLVRNKIGCKVRSIELNILQRCASHICSGTDINESIEIGRAAVRFAHEGESGKMIVVRRKPDSDKYIAEIGIENVSEIANIVKKVPKSFINETEDGVTESFIEYMLPLIQKEVPQKYEDGLPVHFKF